MQKQIIFSKILLLISSLSVSQASFLSGETCSEYLKLDKPTVVQNRKIVSKQQNFINLYVNDFKYFVYDNVGKKGVFYSTAQNMLLLCC